jgi:putative ABC transport system permease protein
MECFRSRISSPARRRRERLAALLIGSFAVVALVLALLGIFGVLSYHVGRRTQEVGIRAALGASRAELVAMMLSAALRLAIVGLGAGLVAALLATRWLSTLLFGVSAFDPLTSGAVALVLGIGALLACYVPARKAAGVDPVFALRQE